MKPAGTLALTHSSRRTNLARCSAEFLTRRFGDPDRLRHLPPFESLPPPEPLYCGAVSFHEVLEDGDGRLHFRPGASWKHREKVQHVAILEDGGLLAGFEQRVELAGRRYEHPLLAGLHTVAPLPGGRALLSCSASDALLVLDLETGEVEKVLRMPAELYGRNYDLGPGMDLRRHFIGDERQTTHVNAAHPFDGGRRAVVSTLIQGAVGVFDLETGAYEELARGFVGCHGARVSAEGEVGLLRGQRGRPPGLPGWPGAGRPALRRRLALAPRRSAGPRERLRLRPRRRQRAAGVGRGPRRAALPAAVRLLARRGAVRPRPPGALLAGQQHAGAVVQAGLTRSRPPTSQNHPGRRVRRPV